MSEFVCPKCHHQKWLHTHSGCEMLVGHNDYCGCRQRFGLSRIPRVDLPKCMLFAAIIVGITLITLRQAHGQEPPTRLNLSSYDAFVDSRFCEGATIIFVDDLGKVDDGRPILGKFRGYVVVFQKDTPPKVYQDVLLIAMKSIMQSESTFTDVLEHECAHYRQRLRFADYFEFRRAYDKDPRSYENEADTTAYLRREFRVGHIGKTQEAALAQLSFQ